jgi:beta-fructofuranosidase
MISPIPLYRTIYFVGRYENFKFTPEYQGEIDQAGAFYAPQVFLDDHGRRVMFGWSWEGRKPEALIEAGWAGVMTLPRVLSLGSDGKLRYDVAEEIKTLRRGRKQYFDVRVTAQGVNIGSGESNEINLEVEHKDAEKLELKVRCSPDGSEETVISYDGKMLWADWERSSTDPAIVPGKKGTNFTLAEGENLKLRVFVDRSIVEVYANERACLTIRIYPARKDSTGIKLLTRNGEAMVRSADVLDLESVWDDVLK